jgi:pimeloyl-ACP methyl ester carboxylesterase
MGGLTLQPVLILLHGATLNGHMWDPVRRELDARYELLAPDLPGHGSRRRGKYTLNSAIHCVVEAAQSVAPASIVVGGDSLGGYTALAAAASLPARQLKGLVLCGSSSNLTGSTLWSYRLRAILLRALSAVFDEDRLIRSQVAKQLEAMQFPARDIQAMIGAGISLKTFAQAVDALRDVDFRAKLAAVDHPVVIINGDRDKSNVRQEASFLAVAKQPMRHRIANCEHGVSLRCPAEVAGVINNFAAKAFALEGHPAYRSFG